MSASKNLDLSGWRLFKLVSVGYLIGAGIVVGPLAALLNVYVRLEAASPAAAVHAKPVGVLLVMFLKSLLVASIVIAIQSVLIGVFVILGQWVLSEWRDRVHPGRRRP